MSARYKATKALRYGVNRKVIQDTQTGLIAVFVTEIDTDALADRMNKGMSITGAYKWISETPPAPPEGVTE